MPENFSAPRYEFVRANGLRFRVRCEGDGERLALCLHGFPEFSHSWRHQIPVLARLGYRAWAPDLRGFGGSDAPAGVKAYRMRHLVADVAGLVDASGARETVLIGHDWGAYIAWAFAMDRVRPLSKLAIVNVPHPGAVQLAMRGFGGGSLNWSQLQKSLYMLFFQIPKVPERIATAGHAWGLGKMLRRMVPSANLLTDADIAAYRDNACLPGHMTAMMNYYRALARYDRFGTRRVFPTIDVPTLLLWGTADTALGVEGTFATDRFVSRLTSRYLPGISHLAQQHAAPAVNEALEAFLKGERVPQAGELGLS